MAFSVYFDSATGADANGGDGGALYSGTLAAAVVATNVMTFADAAPDYIFDGQMVQIPSSTTGCFAGVLATAWVAGVYTLTLNRVVTAAINAPFKIGGKLATTAGAGAAKLAKNTGRTGNAGDLFATTADITAVAIAPGGTAIAEQMTAYLPDGYTETRAALEIAQGTQAVAAGGLGGYEAAAGAVTAPLLTFTTNTDPSGVRCSGDGAGTGGSHLCKFWNIWCVNTNGTKTHSRGLTHVISGGSDQSAIVKGVRCTGFGLGFHMQGAAGGGGFMMEDCVAYQGGGNTDYGSAGFLLTTYTARLKNCKAVSVAGYGFWLPAGTISQYTFNACVADSCTGASGIGFFVSGTAATNFYCTTALEGCVIKDCAVAAYYNAGTAGAPGCLESISIRNCHITGHAGITAIQFPGAGVTANILTARHCRFAGNNFFGNGTDITAFASSLPTQSKAVSPGYFSPGFPNFDYRTRFIPGENANTPIGVPNGALAGSGNRRFSRF